MAIGRVGNRRDIKSEKADIHSARRQKNPKYQLLECVISWPSKDIRYFGSNIHYSAFSPPNL